MVSSLRRWWLSVFVFASVATSTATAHADGSSDTKRSAKRNEIVGFFNTEGDNGRRAIDLYLKVVGKKGPTCETDESLAGLRSTSISYLQVHRLDDMRSTVKAKPAIEKLDSLTKQMVDAYEDLSTSLKDAGSQFRSVKTTAECKKAQSLHAKVKASSARFIKARGALETWLTDDQKKRAQLDLKAIEKKYGKKFRFHRLKTMTEAHDMVNALEVKADRATISKFTPTVDALVKLEASKHSTADQYGYTSFVQRIKELVDTANWHVDQVAAGKPGDIDRVFGSYNAAVDAHNQVTFSDEFN